MPSVGAFNLSLVRGCAHYCKLNSLGSLRRVTAAGATVICPRRARVYVRQPPRLLKNPRETRYSASWIQDLWSPCCDTLRSSTGHNQFHGKIHYLAEYLLMTVAAGWAVLLILRHFGGGVTVILCRVYCAVVVHGLFVSEFSFVSRMFLVSLGEYWFLRELFETLNDRCILGLWAV